ncbi:hypothetical protein DH86_00000037 [Scytalidium sp. 3C]|nr:hypothetical protein DH86_00000037 [Scytalidium sp. 3C]
MSLHTEIEINASPEEVRAVGHKEGPIEVGEKLAVDFSGMKTKVVVTENEPTRFSWRGDLYFVLSGNHTFIFEPSTKTPGGTTFKNQEVFARFNTVLMRLVPPTKLFQQLCEDLKAKVEASTKGASQSAEGGDGAPSA